MLPLSSDLIIMYLLPNGENRENSDKQNSGENTGHFDDLEYQTLFFLHRIKLKNHTDYIWILEIHDEYKKNTEKRKWTNFFHFFFNIVIYERVVIFLFLFIFSESDELYINSVWPK